MSNMNFLIADVIYFVSSTKITFSQRDATKIKSKLNTPTVHGTLMRDGQRALVICPILMELIGFQRFAKMLISAFYELYTAITL